MGHDSETSSKELLRSIVFCPCLKPRWVCSGHCGATSANQVLWLERAMPGAAIQSSEMLNYDAISSARDRPLDGPL